MANLTLRLVKGSPLTNAEVDANFSNLNTAKYEAGDSPDFVNTTTDILSFDLLANATPTQGQAVWSEDDRTVSIGLNGLALPVGQEELIFVRNSTASPIAKGTAVMATGTIGMSGRITAAPMDGTNVANAKFLIGIAAETIAAGADGFVANFGKIRGFNTSAFSEGDVLWISTTTPGALTATQPTSGLKLPVAFVVASSSTVGALFVRMTTGNKISEAHDATFTTLANGDVLIYNSGVWENKTQANLFPSQTSQAGKFLTTNGAVISWANVPSPNNGTLTMNVSGTGLSGSATFTADQAGGSTFTVTSNATSANTAGAIVARDGSGNFTAGTITAALSGNASTATILQTTRTINGVNFNGSANITVTASTPSSVTFNNGGAGAASGTAFNGGGAVTVSYNTVGAPSTGGANASGTWGINITGSSASTTGNAATATALQTARLIGGVSFNGTANINLPGVNTAGNQNTSGNAATATTATNANNVAIAADTASTGSFFVPYVSATTGNVAMRGTRLTVQPSTGNFTAVGTVTANSDERIKTDWAGLPADFIERLAGVKSGTYTRLDTGARQAGSSAQDWQKLLPEVVTVGDDEQGTLSLGYGNAALVAAVELAKVVVELKAEVQSLKAQLKG
jgi:hypothetical protein